MRPQKIRIWIYPETGRTLSISIGKKGNSKVRRLPAHPKYDFCPQKVRFLSKNWKISTEKKGNSKTRRLRTLIEVPVWLQQQLDDKKGDDDSSGMGDVSDVSNGGDS